MARVTIKKFGIQIGTDNTLFVTWDWPSNLRSKTDSYQVRWTYTTGDSVAFIGNDGTTKDMQSLYTPPSNARTAMVTIRPIAKTTTVNGKEQAQFVASWSTTKQYIFQRYLYSTPSVPSVVIDKYKLTASVEKFDAGATHVQFQVIRDNRATPFKVGTAKIITDQASFSCTIAVGSQYKVRCRAIKGNEHSEWSDYSANEGTIPSASKKIIAIKALSETSVAIDWENVSNCTSYDIEYTTNKSYFDSSNEVQSQSVDSVVGHAEITGMETGRRYFFRVRAVNDKGASAWTPIRSIIIGSPPVAPTTWSSTTTVVTGETLYLYWMHNSEDNSSETIAQLELYIDGNKTIKTIEKSVSEDEKDKTGSERIFTTQYTEGTVIQWRVRTAGITRVFGEWSVQRKVDVYAPPTLELSMTNKGGSEISILDTFPFYISGETNPNTQVPNGYKVVITAENSYRYIDQVGNTRLVNKGDSVYSKYFNTNRPLLIELSAGSIDLENNAKYKVVVSASMNTGLTATSSLKFSVGWKEHTYEPDASIGIDRDALTAIIRPYCEDANGNLISGVSLSVYRREFDGTFTEIATDLDNTSHTYVSDPHPALDYARYRIVAVTKSTGAVSYYDVPGYPVGESSIIIQWAEAWSNFDSSQFNEADITEHPTWAGSMLKLPYNIDVSDNVQTEAELVKYVGREHPVSYYGTQIESSSTWNSVIDKEDKENVYALRRLAIWKGDVYVREPSGTGYWANVKVSFSMKYSDLTIPVTLNITRVEGGM